MKALNFLLLRTPLQSLALASTEPPLNLSPMFIDGLRLAAPVFYSELQKSTINNKKEEKKIEESLYKYWLRSCTRCTPYGFFAGSTIVKIEDSKSSMILDESNAHKLRARLDMNYLSLLTIEIEKLENIQSQLKFSVNNSLYETPGNYRYVEYSLAENFRTYKLSSIEKTEYLDFILEYAKDSKTLDDLIIKLVKFSGVKLEEAREYILEVVSSQLLISNLQLTVSGIDPLTNLISELEQLEGTTSIVDKLKQIDVLLAKLTDYRYEDVESKILQIFDLEGKHKDVVQVDLSLTTIENTINSRLIEEIVSQAKDLQALARVDSNVDMDYFKSKFFERYESAEVSLAIALDDDLGIGYGSEKSATNEWIANIPEKLKLNDVSFRQDFIIKYVYNKYRDFIANKREEIELTEDELKNLPKNNYRFTPSSYLFGSLFGNTDFNEHNFNFHLSGFSKSSCGTMLGRFTLGDHDLTSLTKSALENEEAEYPDAIFAEIIHIPQARSGNILLRSSLRKHEIPYLGKSVVAEEFQIPISDLTVSVKNDEVILKSIKNKKRVFPRLSSAHNFSLGSLPVYKFLGEIQSQGLAQADVWDWGVFNEEKYLPRVRYKNLILQRARWLVAESEITGWPIPTETEAYQSAIESFRDIRGLPKLVSLVQGDNNLLIDLDNHKAVSLMIDFIKKYKTVFLAEFLFNSENCVVRDKNNMPFTNEMIIPFISDFGTPNITAIGRKLSSIQRRFAPSSEWLFVKIYGGEKTLEKILLKTIHPFIEKGLQENFFEKFFFIRYRDPGKHLRLRFYNTDYKDQSHLQNALMQALMPHIQTGQIEKVVIDTYNREIERYSGELIVESESMFSYDSICVLRMNKLLSEVEEEQKYRIILAMRGIDALLNDFSLNLTKKIELAKSMSMAFMQEFGGSASLKRTINDNYRKLQKDIFANMDERLDQQNGIEEAITIFKAKSRDHNHVIDQIKNVLSIETDHKRSDNLLRDYIHMQMNRLFITQQRKYEVLVYSFLERYYSSQFAIMKKFKI